MHGEAADKPRYSFNFRVGLGRWGGKRKGRKGGEGGREKWKRKAHKKGKCSTGRGGRSRGEGEMNVH